MTDTPEPATGSTGSHIDGGNVRDSSASIGSRNSRQGHMGRQDTKFSSGKNSNSKKTRRSDGTQVNNKFRASNRIRSQSQQQQQQNDEDNYDDDDNFTMQSDLPGAIHVGGHAASGRSLITSRNEINSNIEEGRVGDENLPLALPAEVVEARETIIATLADDYIDNQNKREDNVSRSDVGSTPVILSVRSLLVIACIVVVIAVAVSVGVGVILAGRNNDNSGMKNDDELIPPASGNLQQDGASTSSTSTSNPTSIPTATADPPRNPQETLPPTSDPPSSPPTTSSPMGTPPPNVETGQVCSCWYYTQEIYVSSRDDYKELTDTQQGYFEGVYKSLLNAYEPTNGNFVQLGITTTKVFIESQSLFGNFNTNVERSGISLAYQLEYCGPTDGGGGSGAGGVTEDLLVDSHTEYSNFMFEKVHRDGVVSSLQQEVGLSSATALSTANRLDLSC